MKYVFLTLLFIISYNLYSQDLYVTYWNVDQKDEYIKSVEIHDNEGIKTEKRVQAKSQIQLINNYKAQGYELLKIETSAFPNASMIKYHIWFIKTMDKKEDK